MLFRRGLCDRWAIIEGWVICGIIWNVIFKQMSSPCWQDWRCTGRSKRGSCWAIQFVFANYYKHHGPLNNDNNKWIDVVQFFRSISRLYLLLRCAWAKYERQNPATWTFIARFGFTERVIELRVQICLKFRMFRNSGSGFRQGSLFKNHGLLSFLRPSRSVAKFTVFRAPDIQKPLWHPRG